MKPQEVYQQLFTDPEAYLIDVREPEEYAAGHAEEAVNYPMSGFPNNIQQAFHANAPLYLICQSGGRSLYATDWLKQHGYSKVVNVETGMNGWLQAKLPVIRPALPEEPS
jgi:rhodanese-related sulfurtransferase